MRCYIFDIDGTLADIGHRLHHIQKEPKDWRAFFAACKDDKPIDHMVTVCRALKLFDIRTETIFVSGRSDEVRMETLVWLKACDLYGNLYMRKAGDHRPDDIVKGELLDQILADGYRPVMAFDDRARVVGMWRSRGIPCAQVADGDF